MEGGILDEVWTLQRKNAMLTVSKISLNIYIYSKILCCIKTASYLNSLLKSQANESGRE